jgi:hypothetical protein
VFPTFSDFEKRSLLFISLQPPLNDMDGIGRELFNKSDKIKHYAIFQERPKFTAQVGVRIPLENLNPLGPRALSNAQTL